MAKVENETEFVKSELKSIGKDLKASREAKELSIWALAKLTNMNWHAIKKMEDGSHGYSMVSYIKYRHFVDRYKKNIKSKKK